ncbi:MAG: 5'-methylthioadenosine/adenosylhomocysteine nucleosidase [Flavobacteriaceae bacterium]|nr:5'-methylthioadenosine/adenosylhomocysteine nucleosidase [Flavobacteriaceae bacterium]
MSLGIMSAMPEEINSVLNAMTSVSSAVHGNRTFYKGLLYKKPVVLVFSNWGKVAAATTATQLIQSFNIKKLIFTGVAGALQEHLNIGDVVVGKHLYQHDMDARPLYEQFEIPIIKKKFFKTDVSLTKELVKASEAYLQAIPNNLSHTLSSEFGITNPKVFTGGIASGDQFISSIEKIEQFNKNLPDVLCVEMEGAAVAQVCFDYKVCFAIMRTLSDKAKANASIDFQKFAKQVASTYALGILEKILM